LLCCPLAILIGTVLANRELGAYGLLVAAALCLLAATAVAVKIGSTRLQALAAPGSKTAARKAVTDSFRGVFLAVLAGLFMGGATPITNSGLWGDLGLGPYAGLLLFACGLLAAVLVFGFFFMNIGLQGSRATIPQYVQLSPRSHILAVFAGVLASFGVLALLLAKSAPEGAGTNDRTLTLCVGGVVVVLILLSFGRGELNGQASPARIPTLLSLALFCAGLILLSLRFVG
jgi:hypothetical protein